MNGLKKQNKELSDEMDAYPDQIHELESSNKNMDTPNTALSIYKVKNAVGGARVRGNLRHRDEVSTR
jgi:hypothetical protein